MSKVSSQMSREAFRDLIRSGALNRHQRNLIRFMFRRLTQGEPLTTQAHAELEFDDDTRTYGPRFGELEAMGVIRVNGTMPSPKTNREVTAYELTGEMPEEAPPRRDTAARTLSGVAEMLGTMIARCRPGKLRDDLREVRQYAVRRWIPEEDEDE